MNPYEKNITKINWFHDDRTGDINIPYQFVHKTPIQIPRHSIFSKSSPKEIVCALDRCGLDVPKDVLIDENLDMFEDHNILLINSTHHSVSLCEALNFYPIFTVYESIDEKTFFHIKKKSFPINSESIPFHNECGPARVTEKSSFYFIHGRPLGISEIVNMRIKKL